MAPKSSATARKNEQPGKQTATMAPKSSATARKNVRYISLYDAFTDSTAKVPLGDTAEQAFFVSRRGKKPATEQHLEEVERLLVQHEKMCEGGLAEIRAYAEEIYTLKAMRCPRATNSRDCAAPCEWMEGGTAPPACRSRWDPRNRTSQQELQRLRGRAQQAISQEDRIALAVLENLHSVTGGITEIIEGLGDRMQRLPRAVEDTLKMRTEFNANPAPNSPAEEKTHQEKRAAVYAMEQVLVNDVGAVEKAKPRLEEIWQAATPAMRKYVMLPEFSGHDLARARLALNLADEVLRFFRNKVTEHKWQPLSAWDISSQGRSLLRTTKNAISGTRAYFAEQAKKRPYPAEWDLVVPGS
jgi:hypothetical protein